MSLEKAARMMKQIDEIEKLTDLVLARRDARLIYEALRDAFQSTRNPLFHEYMEIVALSGDTINADIAVWFSNQANLHGETLEWRHEEESDRK